MPQPGKALRGGEVGHKGQMADDLGEGALGSEDAVLVPHWAVSKGQVEETHKDGEEDQGRPETRRPVDIEQ